MTSRERVEAALAHRTPDRVPIDLGACGQTGMQVSAVYRLRQALKLDPPGTPVKVTCVFQMLGEIKPDLLEAVGGDVVGVGLPYTFFGAKIDKWKEWTTFDGTPVLIPDSFNTEPDANGDLMQYPQGDFSAPPSAKMPHGGFYCDSIVRQDPIDDDKLDPMDNCEEFKLLSDADLQLMKEGVDKAWNDTDKAIMLGLPNMAFGDIALVPGPSLKHPRGIRDMEEWYMSTVSRRDYVAKIFDYQCEIALQNLARVYDAVGNKPAVVWVSGADFGAQTNSIVSPRAFRALYKPYMKRLNNWIHANTTWKTFIHSCGSIMNLIPDMIEAGWDVLNPVQTSAANMDPQTLKDRFGSQVTFWGGGVDTQHTLPFVTPDAIRAEVKRNLEIFGRNGGYVFNTIHNVQQGVPVENLLAMYETAKNFKGE